MGVDSVEDAEDFGVLVINAWRESPEHPLVLRITTSRGEEEESVVTVSVDQVDAVVHRWLDQFQARPHS